MIKILLLTGLLILPFQIFSQEKVKKTDSVASCGIYLDFTGGMSFPVGSYAKSDTKNSGSGYATQGFAGQINLDWINPHSYGLALQYTFQDNPLNRSVKNDTLAGMYHPLGSGSWVNHYLMAGVSFLKFIHKFYIEGKALIGIVLSSSPLFKSTDPATLSTSTNRGVGSAYCVQMGAGYAVSKRVTVKANIEYLLGNPKIRHKYGAQVIGYNDTLGLIYSAPLDVETKRTVSALLVKAGIVVKLSK